MKDVTSHRVNGLNDEIKILATNRGPGNAYHDYVVSIPGESQTIHFQEGPIKEVGVNGVSNEALLAIVEDRLIEFQAGNYACRENAVALTKIQEALMWLKKRTQDRMARGVEGTSTK